MVDYRKLTWKGLFTPEFSHLLLLLYWPLFGILFFVVERVWIRDSYFVTHCFLDAHIPFCELFVIPYFFWFVFLIGMHIYTLLFDVDTFRKLMRFIMLTYTASLVIYVLFPNCQEFRPAVMPRDNILTRVVSFLYGFDTNTNVCPSLHVVGSMAVLSAAWNSRHFSTRPWRIAFTVAAVLISISTLFLRQHSVVDLLAALPICYAAYVRVYGRRKQYVKERANSF
jgi:hypothetical protein